MPLNFLLTSQKNGLFTAIKDKGLSPSDFSFVENAAGTLVNHRDTSYVFSISIGRDRYRSETYYSLSLRPGSKLFEEDFRRKTWADVLEVFNYWLRSMISEIRSPDLWATVSGDTQLINLAADQDNQPFTPKEQIQVKKALEEIKAYLFKVHTLTEEQTKIVEARFDYLEDAASRLGRKDWTNILVSGLIGIVTTLALGAESGRDFFTFAGQIVKQLLGTVLYLSGPH